MSKYLHKKAYYKAVSRALMDCGYSARATSTQHSGNIPELAPDYGDDRKALTSALRIALRRSVGSDPQNALRLVTAITQAVTPDNFSTYRELMFSLFKENRLFRLWAETREDETAYAFALFFLTTGVNMETCDVRNATISTLLGRPFKLGESKAKWKDEFVCGMFGPVCHSLYMRDTMSHAEFIDFILKQRPPIVWQHAEASPVAYLPTGEGISF